MIFGLLAHRTEGRESRLRGGPPLDGATPHWATHTESYKAEIHVERWGLNQAVQDTKQTSCACQDHADWWSENHEFKLFNESFGDAFWAMGQNKRKLSRQSV